MALLGRLDLVTFILSISLMLASARILGELFRRLHQPPVIGEILAGILLGHTILGRLAPSFQELIFPSSGPVAIAREGLVYLAVILFLMVAGMEVDFLKIIARGRSAITIAVMGMIAPFIIGFTAAFFKPEWIGDSEGMGIPFAFFFATALSISALPVIAKILMDLKIYSSDLGMTIIAAAVFTDLAGWLIFAIVLSTIGGPGLIPNSIVLTIFLTMGFMLFMLTAGRWVVDRILPRLQAHWSWPAGALSFAISGALVCAAFTEWFGVHAIFGAFLFGVAFGDSRHLRERTRKMIDQFVSSIFAPLFLVNIGLNIDFIKNFDLRAFVVITGLAFIGKISGCRIGTAIAGMSTRESWAIGFAMNARGAMEIILASIAHGARLIGDATYVAIILMSIVTSMISGSILQRILKLHNAKHFTDYLSARFFIGSLSGKSSLDVINELMEAAWGGRSLNGNGKEWAKSRSGEVEAVALANGVAIPYLICPELKSPIIAAGISDHGVDFNSPDGESSRVVFLVLTSKENLSAQAEIVAGIESVFKTSAFTDKVTRTLNFTEFLAMLKSGDPG